MNEITITVDNVAEVVENFFSDIKTATPYKFAALLSKVSGINVRPQMMYNYAKNNKSFREAVKVNAEFGLKYLERDFMIQFSIKYITRNVLGVK